MGLGFADMAMALFFVFIHGGGRMTFGKCFIVELRPKGSYPGYGCINRWDLNKAA